MVASLPSESLPILLQHWKKQGIGYLLLNSSTGSRSSKELGLKLSDHHCGSGSPWRMGTEELPSLRHSDYQRGGTEKTEEIVKGKEPGPYFMEIFTGVKTGQ